MASAGIAQAGCPPFALPTEKENLHALMQSAYEDRDTTEEKMEYALRTPADYAWASAVEKMEEALMALKEMP